MIAQRPRPDRFDLALAVAAAAGTVLLVLLGRGLTFFWDEWEFIQARSLTDPSTWLVPHGEHWVTLPVLVYRALIETVGLHTYVPYLAVLIALHVLVVVGVYLVIRRAGGPWPALLAAIVVLLFGSGFENLFWAFQIAFVASTVLCLAALLVLDGQPTRRRAIALLAVLLAGLMTSGLGLATAVIVGVEMLLRPPWRRHAWILVVAAAVFAAWFLAIGRVNVGSQGNPFTAEALLSVPSTVVDGFAGAAGGVFGLGPILGVIAMIALLAVVAVRAARRTLPARVVATLAGLLALYVIVGLARTEHPGGGAPRLVYFGGPLLLVAMSQLLGIPRLPAAPRPRVAAFGVAAVVVALSLSWNVTLLVNGANLFARRADITRAMISLELSPPPDRPFDRSKPQVVIPSADILERIVARYGSPLSDDLAPVPPISAEARAKAEAYLFDAGPIPVP